MEPLPLIPHMSSYILNHLNLITNSHQEAQAFSNKLIKLQEGVRGAETLQVIDPTCESWIKDVEAVMFQLEDEFDSQLTPAAFNDLSEQVDTLIDNFNFDYSKELRQDEPPSSVNDSKSIFSRDAVMEKLVTKLVTEDAINGNGVSVIIPIVGIAGVGKTTLAQLAFHHPQVVNHFGSMRAYVTLPSLPNPSNEDELIVPILKELGEIHIKETYTQYTPFPQWNTPYLESIVSAKPAILIVLDNVTTENVYMYESLPESLRDNPRFKCLVITKSEVIARRMARNDECIHLSLLSDSDCENILNQIALGSNLITEEAKKELQEIVSELAKRCDGLPMATRAIGSMLAAKSIVDEELAADDLIALKSEWDDVLRSSFWDYTDDVENESFRWLNVCYVDLPLELRGCFLSCVVFTKGVEIDVDELIRIWMAWGYLDSTQSSDEVWLKGLGYVKGLVARSFLQEFNEISMFVKVHDLMHDFATYVSKNKNGLIYDGKSKKQYNSLSNRLPFTSLETMRFFITRNDELPLCEILISQLKRVRHLVLSNCNLSELPSEIGKLVHLRYLDVSDNGAGGLSEFPETAYNLCHLQTLNLSGNPISELPDGIERLQSLRHLFLVDSAIYMQTYPQGFEKLTNLWTLNVFVATPYTVSFLGGLNELRGSLTIIFNLFNEDTDIEDAKKANLREKLGIDALDLTFTPCCERSMEMLEATIPPPQIRSLKLWGPLELPSWITSAAVLNNLKELRCGNFDNNSDLPPIGKLPLLEKLTIDFMRFETLTTAFLGISEGDGGMSGGFQRLKELSFLRCYNWNEWEDVESGDEGRMAFPCLEKLKLSECLELRSFPSNLLSKAKVLRMVACESDLGERCNISQILPNAEIRWIQ